MRSPKNMSSLPAHLAPGLVTRDGVERWRSSVQHADALAMAPVKSPLHFDLTMIHPKSMLMRIKSCGHGERPFNDNSLPEQYEQIFFAGSVARGNTNIQR